ncbi:hypothetical protein Val02_14090 [Virgisporangium aliadipatigenens]|uniref:Uncharacterized protein n=1 Tax=Virgisporangium aliadipatigenens TaxID=741659 RepID=A0A8J3YHX2_9ACTN|nr:hypothetical protein [Virgisporangium aliadipatigenens]GIJ44523.1 hypothetical protein Val02_14090 [Virgisporangium aliadipatigenens]
MTISVDVGINAEYRFNVPDDLCDVAPLASLDANLHLRAEHPITLRVHGDDNRVVLKFGTPSGSGLCLFLPADQVDRLGQILAIASQDLAASTAFTADV